MADDYDSAVANEGGGTRVYWGGGRRRNGCCGCGSGCGSFLVVLLLGGLLSIFDVAIGVGVSFQIPFTPSNFTATGSVGTKEKAVEALPNYAQRKFADNENFINHSTTLTIGPAQGVGLLVIGEQTGAPSFDIHVDTR